MSVNAIDTAEIVRHHRNDDGTYRLVELALAIGAERELWQPVVDAADGVNRHWRACAYSARRPARGAEISFRRPSQMPPP